MKFTYSNRNFIGDGLTIRVNGGVTLETKDKAIEFTGWNEVREFMYRFEEINRQAALTGKRQKYGKNLIINYDDEEDMFTIFWKGHSIDVNTDILKQLDVILRFFVKNYHKTILENRDTLEGLELDTGVIRYTTVTDRA